MKIILFNSPKGSGKSVVSDMLRDRLLRDDFKVYPLTFKYPLFDITPHVFGIEYEYFMELYESRTEKETPIEELAVSYQSFQKLQDVIDVHESEERFVEGHRVALSPREAMIFASEVLLKPVMGADYFGHRFVSTINVFASNNEIIIDDSTGFPEEVEPVIKAFGADNICIVRVNREGFDEWGSDSRGWVTPEGVTTFMVDNNGEPEECADQLHKLITEWIDGYTEEDIVPDQTKWIIHHGQFFKDCLQHVIDWHVTAGKVTTLTDQARLVDEEYAETELAYNRRDPIEFLDGLCDLFVTQGYYEYIQTGELDCVDLYTEVSQEAHHALLSDISEITMTKVLDALVSFNGNWKGALLNVIESNWSKFDRYVQGDESKYGSHCIKIMDEGRYTNVHWIKSGDWVVYLDGVGKILKGMSYNAPVLEGFINKDLLN
jgi:hypothetical protein